MSAEPHNALPFDERNQQDFVLTTKRIQEALAQLAKDRRLKRTESNLARLAGCSRGTLRNRKWPLEQLQQLKEDARAAKEPAEPEARNLREKTRIERYREQLIKSRDELLIWKYKHDDLRDKILTLETQRDTHKRRCEELEEQLRAIARSSRKQKSSVAVLSMVSETNNLNKAKD